MTQAVRKIPQSIILDFLWFESALVNQQIVHAQRFENSLIEKVSVWLTIHPLDDDTLQYITCIAVFKFSFGFKKHLVTFPNALITPSLVANLLLSQWSMT